MTASANTLSTNLKWAAGLIWVQFIVSGVGVGFLVYVLTSSDTDDLPVGPLVALGIVMAVTLAIAIYLTIISVKANRQKQMALPLGSATNGHGIALLTIGSIYLILVLAGGIANIVAGQYGAVGSLIVGSITGGCMIRAGSAARKLHKAYRNNPMGTDSFNGDKMNMNNFGNTAYMPNVPMQQPAMYGVPQQQFTGYVPVGQGGAAPMGQWHPQQQAYPAQPNNPLYRPQY